MPLTLAVLTLAVLAVLSRLVPSIHDAPRRDPSDHDVMSGTVLLPLAPFAVASLSLPPVASDATVMLPATVQADWADLCEWDDLAHLACWACGCPECEDDSHLHLGARGVECLRCLGARCLGDCGDRARAVILDRELTLAGAPAPVHVDLDTPCDPDLWGARWAPLDSSCLVSISLTEGA